MSDQTPAAAPRPPMLAVLFSYALYALMIAVILAALFMAWPSLVAQFNQRFFGAKEQVAPAGNVGGQAPPAVRGTNAEVVVQPPVARPVVSTPLPGVAQNEEQSLKLYQTAVAASEAAQPLQSTPAPAPLPLNDAGAPVIDQVQLQQQAQALELAAQEALRDARAAQLADAAARPPDVSYEDAAALLHRDPCHVPRADPATCARGLFKPTPVQP